MEISQLWAAVDLFFFLSFRNIYTAEDVYTSVLEWYAQTWSIKCLRPSMSR